MSYKTLKKIAISEENYPAIKRLRRAGDSFNDVVTIVILNSEKNGKDKQTKSNIDNQIHNRRSGESNQVKITNSKVIKSSCVTICLTNSHDECTGSYESGSGEFKIECHCSCHYNSGMRLDENREAQFGEHVGYQV
jgi:predicted CopG family antitoxin